MKLILTLLMMFMVTTTFSKEKEPTTWGKIIESKKDSYGFKYFVYFKKGDKHYAYPISHHSKISPKKLKTLVGKYAQIYGGTNFEPINLDSTKHIMTFVVDGAKELSLADLNTNYDAYKERMNVNLLLKKRVQDQRYTKRGLSDKAVNAAIFIGGAVLAAEVLGTLLAHPPGR